MMSKSGRRRFEHIAGDGTVDEGFNVVRLKLRLREDGAAGLRTSLRRPGTRWPHPPLFDPRHQLKPTGR